MAIAVEKTSNAPVEQERLLLTGLAEVSVIGVNPNAEELRKITDGEIDLEEDPTYTGIDSGTNESTINLRFYLKGSFEGKPFYTSIGFRLMNEERYSSNTDKYQWINGVCDSTWAKSKEDLDSAIYFRNENARKAVRNEVELYSFLFTLSGKSKKGEADFLLDTPLEKLIDGNVKELRKFIEGSKDKTIKVLLGIRNGQYQAVYDKHVFRSDRKVLKTNRGLLDAMGLQRKKGKITPTQYGWDCDFAKSTRLQKYEPSEDFDMSDYDIAVPVTAVEVTGNGVPATDDYSEYA